MPNHPGNSMEPNFTDAHTLLDEARKSGQFEVLLSQLQKDFERASVPFPLPQAGKEAHDPGKILHALRESLYLLLMERFDQYLNLMYAADVPEREFRDVPVTDAVEVAEAATFILLKREWQKVRYRSRQGKGGTP